MPIVMVLCHRWHRIAIFAITVAFTSIVAGQSDSVPPADRVREIDRLIDALASRNEAPKLVGEKRAAYPDFPANFDWNDQKRVKEAAWTLAQDESNDLWGHLVEHFNDKRYSATCELDEFFPDNFTVGDICVSIAMNKLRCAYLRHLEPGKTSHYGGPTFNYVTKDSLDFLPDSVQRELHYSRHVSTRDGLAKWYRTRNGKPLYELQIEVCEWAVEKVKDAPRVAEMPRQKFIEAVKKEIDSLKKSKKPVVDQSRWASPMSDPGWKFYSMKEALHVRDFLLKNKRIPSDPKTSLDKK